MDTTKHTFVQHMAMAAAWLRWNGQRGTERQIRRLMERPLGDALTLQRLLTDRGIMPTGVPVLNGANHD